MDDPQLERLASTFRVLADPTRLRILGALAEQPHTGSELSKRLHLTPPTISHHMSKLISANLVAVSPEATSKHYSLDLEALRAVTGDLAPAATPIDTVSDEDRARAKVLRDFFEGESLKTIPAQRKKRVIVLEQLLLRFEPGRDYSEREVNDLLRPAHPDVATLRRELVDYGFMNRAHGVYRVATTLPPRGPTVAQEVQHDELAWLETIISGAARRALNPPPRRQSPPAPPQEMP